MRFSNKTIIITGAGGGIGLAIARKFAEEDANIVLADINMEQLQKAAQRLGSSHQPLLIQCDVSKEEEVHAAVAKAIESFKTFDIIVNNAGLMIFKKLEEHT